MEEWEQTYLLGVLTWTVDDLVYDAILDGFLRAEHIVPVGVGLYLLVRLPGHL